MGYGACMSDIKEELKKLLREHGVFGVANMLQKLSEEEAQEYSSNDLGARGPLAIRSYGILSVYLLDALSEMSEIWMNS